MTGEKKRAELARDFYYLNQFGFARAPVGLGDGGDAKLRRFAAALCNVSGADGEVSEEERAFIAGYCASKGYPRSITDDIPAMCKAAESKTLDVVLWETKKLLTMGSLKKTARQIVYDSIRAAARDGLDERERMAIEAVAKEMEMCDVELSKILDLVEKENDLREERIGVLFPDGHPCLPKDDSGQTTGQTSEGKKTSVELARDFYYLNQFGFTRAPESLGDGGDEILRRFAAALCNVSGADGEVSEEERAFIVGYCACKGYPNFIIDEIPAMCRAAESKTLEAVLRETKELLAMGSLRKSARQLVYDAIRAASLDGLDEQEKIVIEAVAKEMEMSDVEFSKILDLVEKEDVLREARITILFPDGHPCLPNDGSGQTSGGGAKEKPLPFQTSLNWCILPVVALIVWTSFGRVFEKVLPSQSQQL